MKKYLLSICTLLCFSFTFSQECGSDNYYNALKSVDPNLDKKVIEKVKFILEKRKSRRVLNDDEIIHIPVVFNLVYPNHYQIGEGANIHGSILDSQLDYLNQYYSGLTGSPDTKIRFCLARQNIFGAESTGIKRYTTGQDVYDLPLDTNAFLAMDAQIKSHFDPTFPSNSFLNVWIADITIAGSDGIQGYSSNPMSGVAPAVDNLIDGIVLDPDHMYAFKHEAGHWLGLWHTFANFNIPSGGACAETDCDLQGDFICDTETVPNDGRYNIAPGNCNGYNCNNNVTGAVRNIMDYQNSSRQQCSTDISQGQIDHIRDILQYERSTIYSNSVNVALQNNYCELPSGGGGSSYTSPLNPSCRTCYEPGLALPNDYGSGLRSYENKSKGNLFISFTSNGFTSTTNTIRIYERNCLDFELKQTIDTEDIEYDEIYIINDKSFLIVDNSHEVSESSLLRIYKKLPNGIWDIDTEYGFQQYAHVRLHETKLGLYMLYRTGSDIGISLFNEVINRFTGIRTFDGGSSIISDFGSTVSDSSLFLQAPNSSGAVIKEWAISNNGLTFTLTSNEFNFPLNQNVGFGAYTAYKDLFIGLLKDNNNPEGQRAFLRVYKKNGTSWVVHQDLPVGNVPGNDSTFLERLGVFSNPILINEDFIGFRIRTSTDSRSFFFKKDSNDNFSIMNFNYLYPNNFESIDYICTNNFTINPDTKEVILDNMILKLSDFLQGDTSNIDLAFVTDNTLQICSESDEVFLSNNLIIGGNNCTVNYQSVTKNITARNSIEIKNNTIMSGGNVVLKISQESDFNVCDFIGDCPLSRSSLSNENLYSVESERELEKKEEVIEPIVFYPNPNNGLLYLKEYLNLSKIEIYDVYGNIVYSIGEVKSLPIDISKLKKGIYNLVIYTKTKGKLYNRLIVNRE